MSASSGVTVVVDAVRDSAIEFILLFGLWMLFVSQTQTNEIVAGLGAALVGAVADAVLKAADYAKFKPKFKWLLLITWEVWYVLSGTWGILVALGRQLAGKESEAQFKAVKFDAGGDDAESWARRSLVTALITISPNTIVLGVDVEQNAMLLHSMPASPVPEIAKQLGAKDE